MTTEWLDEERDLPLPRQKKGIEYTQTEPVHGYFGVKDIFAFENVGFTRSSEGKRVRLFSVFINETLFFSIWFVVNVSKAQLVL